MEKIKLQTDPKALIDRLSEEAVAILAFGGAEETMPHEQAIYLVSKAWTLPDELVERAVERITKARASTAKDNDSGKLELKMSGGPALDTPDGIGIAQFLRGLFETAVRLDDWADRTAILQVADLMADCLDFEEWLVDIPDCGEESTPEAGT